MQTIGDNPCLPEIIADCFSYKYDNHGVWIAEKYVSLPYFSYGNIEVKNSISKYQKWEYRGLDAVSEYYTKDKVSSILRVKDDVDAQFADFKPNVRRKINKALKNNILVEAGNIELITDFYKVYYENMKRLGSPALSIKFFKAISEKYKNGKIRIFVAYLNNKPIGSAFLLSYGNFYENTWFATSGKYNYLYTSYLLHWEMIKFSVENRAEIYSFGRSTKNSSVHNYKKQWNTEDLQLYWSYSEAKRMNIRNMDYLSKLWKLMPHFIVKWIEPYLARQVY